MEQMTKLTHHAHAVVAVSCGRNYLRALGVGNVEGDREGRDGVLRSPALQASEASPNARSLSQSDEVDCPIFLLHRSLGILG